VRDAIALLASHPHAGHIGRIAKTREFAVPRTQFVIGYEVDMPNNTLHILTVYDGRRRWPKSLPKK
jgi:plasmid stabilization system protein ParE